MFKKLFLSLAPLLVIAAFAVMPVAAQAVTRHWYNNGALMTAGEAVPFVVFGNEINLNQSIKPPNPNTEVNCRTVAGGTIENPVGGGAGVGGVDAVAFYECKAPHCEEETLTRFGLEGRETVEAVNMPASINGYLERRFVPWSMLLEESTVEGVSSVRLKIGEPFVAFKTPSPPGMIRLKERCEIIAMEAIINESIFEGELKPEIGAAKTGNLNGTSAATPSQFKFSGASTGALHFDAPAEGIYTGNLKYLGYNHQEIITVKQ